MRHPMTSHRQISAAQSDIRPLTSDELQKMSGGVLSGAILKNPGIVCVQGIPTQLLKNLGLQQAINPVINQLGSQATLGGLR